MAKKARKPNILAEEKGEEVFTPPPNPEELFNQVIAAAVERGRLTKEDVECITKTGRYDSWHVHQRFAEIRRRLAARAARKPLYVVVTRSDGSVEHYVR